MGNIIAFPFKELRQKRLAGLKDALLREAKAIRAEPLHEGGRHPGYIELGRLLHEASTQLYRPQEIPKPLRQCPWLFVLAELAREFPEVQWGEPSLAEYARLYLATLAEPKVPTSETAALDFAAARKKVVYG